jgi:hypothetical protein
MIGRVAQLGEHCPYKAGVTGSSPVPPTIYSEIGFRALSFVPYSLIHYSLNSVI